MVEITPVIKHKYSEHGNPTKYRLVIDDTRIKHGDYANIKYLYQMCHEFFIEKMYGPRKDTDWPERLYWHRYKQKGGEDVWIWWRFRKEYGRLIRYDLDVDWHILKMEGAEMVKDGKKYKRDKGDIEFKIYAKLIFDPYHDLEKGPFSSFRQVVYERLYFKDLLSHRRQFLHELTEFKQFLKHYLNLQTSLPEVEGHNFWLDEDFNNQFFDKAEKKQGPPPS